MSKTDAIPLFDQSGRMRGFANLLSKENGLWWRTRKWWVQSLVWTLISNGIIALILWVIPAFEPSESVPPLSEILQVFISIHTAAATIGVIVIVQGAIVGEKKSGTAEWILSNPVSRTDFILSKLLGNALGIMVIILIMQFSVGYFQISVRYGGPLPLTPFVKAMGLTGLILFFYLALTLMLGTFFSGRGPVIGISIAVLVAQEPLGGLLSHWLPWLPWVLPESVMGLVGTVILEQPLPEKWFIPILSTVILSILFILVAIERFKREEF
jgi:ABC-2 type transport system permease protein